MLYINRGLVQINLLRYEKAIEDFKTALRLNENSLKAQLLMAKTFHLLDNKIEFNNFIKEAKEKHQDQIQFIDGRWAR